MKNSHIFVLVLLVISNIINVLFLFLDPRNPYILLNIQIILGSIGILYIISLILCLKKKSICYFLNLILGIVSSPIVIADNLNLFSPPPVPIIYFLNFSFLAVQILLIGFSIDALKYYFFKKD